jgi:hypothetical protein
MIFVAVVSAAGQRSRPRSMRRAHTHNPQPSKKTNFKRFLRALAKRKT